MTPTSTKKLAASVRVICLREWVGELEGDIAAELTGPIEHLLERVKREGLTPELAPLLRGTCLAARGAKTDAKTPIVLAVNAARRILHEVNGESEYDAFDADHALELLGRMLGVDLAGQGAALRHWLGDNPRKGAVRLVAWALTVAKKPRPARFEEMFAAKVEWVNKALQRSRGQTVHFN